MRICLFTDTLGDLNGVSRFIQDMGEQADQHDIDLQIITSTQKDIPQKPYIHNLPLRFKVPMPFYQELDLVYPKKKAIYDILEQLQPDVVHISTPGPFGWISKNIAERLGYPLVGTYHTDFPAYLYDLTRMEWVKRRTDAVMARFYAPFEHVFSRSETYLEVMASDIEIDYDRASVLKPGTNLQRFNPSHHNRTIWSHYGLKQDRLKILFVGRINIEKNIPFLIEVWKVFCKTHPNIKADLVMIGEGRYRKWADKIRPFHAYFLGPVTGENLSELYASSDLFIFPSITDTLGQVIMEAQASGVGCLVSDIGGPQSLIEDDETGQILEADNPQTWVDALYHVLTRHALRNHWSQKTRPHAEGYDIVDSFKQFFDVHQQIHQRACKQKPN